MVIEFFNKYPDYKIEEKPTDLTIKKYSKILPSELMEFWKEYGFGTYMNGYLKIVNPVEYQNILNEAYYNPDNEIVFGITALGDFLVWVGDAIRLIDFRHGKYRIINSNNLMRFFERRLCDESFLRIEFNNQNFEKGKEKLGDLVFDECYGYVPLLGMGGSEKVENLQKVKIKEYISITAQALGKIE